MIILITKIGPILIAKGLVFGQLKQLDSHAHSLKSQPTVVDISCNYTLLLSDMNTKGVDSACSLVAPVSSSCYF